MRTVTLDRQTHIYRDDLGREYVSVGACLKKLFPFDAREIAQMVSRTPNSRYYGQSAEAILKQWDGRRDAGTALHNAIEAAMAGQSYQPTLRPFVDRFKSGAWKGALKIEQVLHDEALFLAGTADIIEQRPKEDVIWDIKTCRKIGEEKLLQYSAQIGLYARMSQQLTGKPTRAGGILWYENFPNCSPRPQILKPLDAREIVRKVLLMRVREICKIKPIGGGEKFECECGFIGNLDTDLTSSGACVACGSKRWTEINLITAK